MSRVTDPEGPVPSRPQLILSTRDWSPLEDVARAVSGSRTEYETKLYVERLDAEYRWSLIIVGARTPYFESQLVSFRSTITPSSLDAKRSKMVIARSARIT